MIRLLIRLFPKHFREQYGDDMRDVYRDQLTAARRLGPLAVAGFRLRTICRTTAAAWHERRDTRPIQGHSLMLDFIRHDLRFTVRAIRRAPAFTLITVTVIALGIGAVATIFSALNALVLRPIPGTTNGHELFTIDRRAPDFSEGVSMSGRLFRHVTTSTESLDGLAVWSRVQLSLSSGERNTAVNGSIVSANYFTTLGLVPATGRFFSADEASPALVISHRLWQSHFSGAPDIVGRRVTLNGRPYTVIGVAPEGFRGVFTPLRMDAWVPLSAQPHVRPGRDLEDAPWLWMFGRVRDDVTPEQARAELTTILGAWVGTGSDRYTDYSAFRFTPLTGLPDDARQALLGFGGLMLGAAVLVLMVAGANVSTLLAMRATTRRHEMGLRTALGAGRARLVRQLLTETVVLFLAGAAGGLVLASAGTWALEQLQLPGDVGLMLELSPDLRVVAVVAAVGLVAALLFGIGPALRGTRHNPAMLLRSGTAGAGTRRGRMTTALIVGQLAGSLVLLTTTSLFVRALSFGAGIDPGFVRENVRFMSFNTEAFGYDQPRSEEFYEAFRTRVSRLGVVAEHAYGQAGPMLAQTSNGEVMIPREGGEERLAVEQTQVGDGYFSTLGIGLIEGRAINKRDLQAPVAVVSESFARRAWPDRPQVTGLTFRRGTRTMTVIGVARDVNFGDIGEPQSPFLYLPLGADQASQILFVRTVPGAQGLERDLAGILRDIDPTVPVPPLLDMSDESALALLPQRVAAMVTGVLGGGALLLAAAGLYGSIAFLVAARAREVGVRMALGATRGDVLRLFLKDGLALTAVGAVLGLGGSLLAARLISGLLLGISTFDPVAFGAALCLLVTAATAAAWAPASRATTVEPAVIMRSRG
ncbi:MAG: ADOP family duplicated permease [Vicinamibacterales bacterium]